MTDINEILNQVPGEIQKDLFDALKERFEPRDKHTSNQQQQLTPTEKQYLELKKQKSN